MDILCQVPECIVVGAAVAADPRSNLYLWLKNELGGADPLPEVRSVLAYLLDVLDACRSTPINDVFDQSRIPNIMVFHAIMFGLGSALIDQYNKCCRHFRFTDVATGAVDYATNELDKAKYMATFDTYVAKARE